MGQTADCECRIRLEFNSLLLLLTYGCSPGSHFQVPISAEAEQQDPLLLLLQQQPTSKVYLNSTFLHSRATHLQGATFLAQFSSVTTDTDVQSKILIQFYMLK